MALPPEEFWAKCEAAFDCPDSGGSELLTGGQKPRTQLLTFATHGHSRCSPHSVALTHQGGPGLWRPSDPCRPGWRVGGQSGMAEAGRSNLGTRWERLFADWCRGMRESETLVENESSRCPFLCRGERVMHVLEASYIQLVQPAWLTWMPHGVQMWEVPRALWEPALPGRGGLL